MATPRRDEMITGAEILARLGEAFALTPIAGVGAAPAERWFVDGGPRVGRRHRLGDDAFCGACDRLRLTADVRCATACSPATSRTARPFARGASDEELAEMSSVSCLVAKLPGHGINEPGFLQPRRPMSAIGG